MQGLGLLGHRVRLASSKAALASCCLSPLTARRCQVIRTIGTELTAVSFSRGFIIELGSTLSVVVASAAGMPISSTHCQVGSVVAVGIAQGGLRSVKWSLFGSITATWVITVPLAACAAAALLAGLRPFLAVQEPLL